LVEGIEYWLTTDVGTGDDANRSYTLIATKKPVGGGVYTSGTAVVLDYDNLGTTNFFVKTRGFNTNTVGAFSTPSGLVEFAPVQTTNAIDANTQAFGSTGALLGGLALTTLLGKLADLFTSSDIGKSIFDKIFETFEEVTGIDLVGDAAAGDLVVASDLVIKADGSSLGATTASIDFIGPIEASGSGDIEVKLADGTKNKDVLAWNADEGKWQTISDCIECDFVNTPPPDGTAKDCFLEKAATLPANNFQGASSICPSSTSVPFTGSYFIKFNINPGYEPPEAAATSTISAESEYEIAKAGNTDFSWWGAPNNSVGTTFIAQDPDDVFPNGKSVKEITVGKRYKIKAVGDLLKADWEALGWEGTTPTIGNEFTAKAVGTGTGTVDKADGSGWVYGQGEAKDSIPLVAPLVKGTGSFKLYGTDGKLEQTLAVADIIIHNNVVELPFKARAPGTDYYIIWDEGVVTNCDCENLAVNSDTVWTFTTSETPVNSYTLNSISPTNIPDGGSSNDVFDRSKIDYTFSPSSSICAASTKLILTFSTEVVKGSGSITIKDRELKTTVASLSVSSATITEVEDDAGEVIAWKVDFGTIPTLARDKYFDVDAPQGLLVTESEVGSSTVCDKTTNTPALPVRRSLAKTWGLKTEEELRVVSVEYCPTTTNNARQRTNIKVTFNKNIKVKTSSPAEVIIYESGLVDSTFQKIDLRGTYANKKYGDIYDVSDSAVDNPDTATNEAVSNRTLIINPTKMMKGATNYHLEIPSGIIFDADCNVAWSGVTDSTTIAWRTDGAQLQAPAGNPLTYGSVLFRFKADRMIVPGTAKLNIITPAGRLKTQISATDLAIRFSHNVPFTD
jgi:hypothetical protein